MLKKLFKLRRQTTATNNKHLAGLKRITSAISTTGGSLHFTMNQGPDGWTASCNEFPGIITGGDQPNPNRDEVFNLIVDAIKTAFDIPATGLSHKLHPMPSPLPIELCYRQEFALV